MTKLAKIRRLFMLALCSPGVSDFYCNIKRDIFLEPLLLKSPFFLSDYFLRIWHPQPQETRDWPRAKLRRKGAFICIVVCIYLVFVLAWKQFCSTYFRCCWCSTSVRPFLCTLEERRAVLETASCFYSWQNIKTLLCIHIFVIRKCETH